MLGKLRIRVQVRNGLAARRRRPCALSMQAYLPHSAERIAASPIGMNLGTAERSVVHARRWLCRAAWLICTGIHSDAAATNGKGVPIALRVCGEVVVGQTESGGFDPFGRLEPTKANVARGSMWRIGVNDEDCTPTLARAQGERRWRGGGPRSRSLPVCCAGVLKPQMRRKHKVELVVEPAEPHPIGSEAALEHAERLLARRDDEFKLLGRVIPSDDIAQLQDMKPLRSRIVKLEKPYTAIFRGLPIRVTESIEVGHADDSEGLAADYYIDHQNQELHFVSLYRVPAPAR